MLNYGLEIERTYICNETFDMTVLCDNNIKDKKSFDHLMAEHYICKQYYISKNENEEIRMRMYEFPFSDDVSYSELTIKKGHGTVRAEVNEKLECFHYDYILEAMNSKSNVIDVKTKEIWEFTLYDGSVLFFNIVNNGALKYIDAEFPNESLAKNFDIYKYVAKEHIKEEMDKNIPKEYIQKEGEK